MTQSQVNVGCLIIRSTMGKSGSQYQRRIESLIKDNGVEWTCNRLKVIWNIALLLRNGDRDKVVELCQSNSIAYHKGTLIPKGPEGIPVKHFIQAQRPSVLKRAAAVLRVYCSLKLGEASVKQVKKATASITGSTTSLVSGDSLAHRGQLSGWDLKQYHPSAVRKATRPLQDGEIHAEKLKGMSKYYSRYKLPRELKDEPYASMAMSFMTEPWVPESLDEQTPCYEMREFIRNDPYSIRNPQQYAGKISFLQEQGCKARVVCQPSAWLQLAFMPWHNRLSRLAEDCFPKESCVNDQESGVYTVLQHMKNGYTVACCDLSSATDRFPRAYSLGILRGIGLDDLAKAFEDVCLWPMDSPYGPMQYEVGQPMGLYASFPLFHLSNLCVAQWCTELKTDPDNYSVVGKAPVPFPDNTYFKVLGDDIIFSDPIICDCYKWYMQDIGVTISDAKSFSGDVVEFAGFIGLRTNQGVTAFRPYKVPTGYFVNNPIQFLDSLGSKCKRINSYWEKQFSRYWRTYSARTLSLDPMVDPDFGETSRMYAGGVRGDNQTMVNLCNVISARSSDELPDLSGNTRINRVPLFRERGMFDFYGYDPELFSKLERSEREDPHRAHKALRDDPLMRAQSNFEKGDFSEDWRFPNMDKGTYQPPEPKDRSPRR